MSTTVRVLLREAAGRLTPVSDSRSSDAQALLRFVLGTDRAWLIAHPDAEINASQRAQFDALVERAASGEPLPYLLGRWPFYDRDFIVTPAVLIPRPETELLLEQALAFSVDRALTAIDVGTGSGALAVTLAALRPRAEVFATDASADALVVARQNACLYDAPVTFLLGDLLTPLIERRVHSDLIMANLPYIPSDEVDRLPVSKHEPRQALDGGRDGLDLIRRLLVQVLLVLNPGGLVLLEFMSGQGETVAAEARRLLPNAAVEILHDYAGHDRIACVRPLVAAKS